jgi:hypothetical protein
VMPFGHVLDVGGKKLANRGDPFGIQKGLAAHRSVHFDDGNFVGTLLGIHRLQTAFHAHIDKIIGILAKFLRSLNDKIIEIVAQDERDPAHFGFVGHGSS